MRFVVDGFKEEDKQEFLDLWHQADPWALNNDRLDIPEANWQNLISPSHALKGFALRDTEKRVLAGYVLYFFSPCIRTGSTECMLRDLFVQTDYRRQGGGTKLVSAVEQEAISQKAGRVFWAANPNREESMGFFSSFDSEKRSETVFIKWLEQTSQKAA